MAIQSEPAAELNKFFQFPGVAIELIQDPDLGPVVEMVNSAYSYQDPHKGEPRTNLAKLRKKAGESEFYVAKQGNEIVGCVYVEHEAGIVHFGLLTVVEKLRGGGLAPALMKAVEAYAVALGVHQIELDYMSVARWLKPYYEKFGYRETGAVRNWGTIDLIQMAKKI